MLSSPRKNGLNSFFKEVWVFEGWAERINWQELARDSAGKKRNQPNLVLAYVWFFRRRLDMWGLSKCLPAITHRELFEAQLTWSLCQVPVLIVLLFSLF